MEVVFEWHFPLMHAGFWRTVLSVLWFRVWWVPTVTPGSCFPSHPIPSQQRGPFPVIFHELADLAEDTVQSHLCNCLCLCTSQLGNR